MGWKKLRYSPELVVEFAEVGVGCRSTVAVVANEPADDGPDLLFGVGLIVLAVGPPPGEANAFALTPGEEDLVVYFTHIGHTHMTHSEKILATNDLLSPIMDSQKLFSH